MQSSLCRQRGLTLIEVAIGMIILGILMSGALAIYRVQQHMRAAEVTARNLETVEEALGTFVSRFNRYPIPMAFAVVEGETGYGQSSALAGSCNASPPTDNRICRSTGAGGGNVLIGSLPFHDLNLPADKTVDGYGRRFTYAVTEMMTVPETPTVPWVPAVCVRRQEMNASGSIVEVDCTAPDNPPQDIALVSHGRDGQGAWTPEGSAHITCGTDGPRKQDANCDNDGHFLQPRGRFQGDTAEYNDDVISVDVLPDSNHWQELTEGIFNRGEHFVGLGVENPGAALDVAGNIKADNLRAIELCERDGDNAINCFTPEKIAGQDPLMRCGEAGLVSGIDHGQVRCQGLMNSFSCPPDQPLSGINADGSPRCGGGGGTTAINGACGPAHGTPTATAPTSNLCNSTGGTPTVSGTGPWTWTCTGRNGGSNADCSADIAAPAVDCSTWTYGANTAIAAYSSSGTSMGVMNWRSAAGSDTYASPGDFSTPSSNVAYLRATATITQGGVTDTITTENCDISPGGGFGGSGTCYTTSGKNIGGTSFTLTLKYYSDIIAEVSCSGGAPSPPPPPPPPTGDCTTFTAWCRDLFSGQPRTMEFICPPSSGGPNYVVGDSSSPVGPCSDSDIIFNYCRTTGCYTR